MSWESQPERSASPDYVNFNVQIQSDAAASQSPVDRFKIWFAANSRLVYVGIAVAAVVIIVIVAVVLTHEKEKELGPAGPNYIEPACTNFYHFSCDPWLKTKPTSTYQHKFFTPIRQNNDQVTASLFNNASSLHPAVRSLYASCQDQAGVRAAGVQPLLPYLAQISAVQDWPQYFRVLGSFRTNFLTESFLHVELLHDLQFPEVTRIYLLQGGLTLDQSSYNDARTMTQFQQEIVSALLSVGDSSSVASQNAALIVQFEKTLLQMFQQQLGATYNIENWAQLNERTGNWTRAYLEGAQVPLEEGPMFRLNVYTPDYFSRLAVSLNVPAPNAFHIQYARWRLINSTALFMPDAWQASSDNIKPVLSKRPIERSRIDKPHYLIQHESRVVRTPGDSTTWSDYCQQVVDFDELTGDVFGESFIIKTFSQTARQYVVDTVIAMKTAFVDWVPSLTWVTDESQPTFNRKMQLMQYYIAGPTPAPGYEAIQSQLRTTGADYFENTRIIRQMQELNRFSFINKPWSNELLWQGSANSINAYYRPSSNAFYLYAGIMQKPAFQMSSDPFVQLQNMAWLYFIGHEAGHGFENSGMQFNEKGVQTRNWPSSTTFSQFSSKLSCIVNSYSSLSEMGVYVNGRTTIGENIADIIGIRMATHMFQKWQVANNATNLQIPSSFQPQVDTLEQYFWVLIGQTQCEVTSRARLQYQVQVDVHSPGFARANGPAANIDEFGTAFGCRRGEDMYPHNQCFIY